MNENKNRISWEQLFMEMAISVSKRSADPKTNVGAVIVKNNRILAIGYNGTISNFKYDFDWATEEKYTYCVHAEENALMNCLRIGANVEGADIYVTVSPCNHCIKLICQSSIKRVFYLTQYKDFEMTEKIAKASGVELIQMKI